MLRLSEKLDIIHWRIFESANYFYSDGIMTWIMHKWALWFEKNSDKKTKMYIYKKRARDLKKDDELLDEDEIEVRFIIQKNFIDISILFKLL